MKDWLCGCAVAFALYSRIPMPRTQWDARTMRTALCFLPLIGAVVGLLGWIWMALAGQIGMERVLAAAIMLALSALVTGGIHYDGFVDTCDALCSCSDPEKRLAILKDPHVGALGALCLGVLLVAQLGLYAQLLAAPALLPAFWVMPMLARTLGGRAVVGLPCARGTGLARTFADGSDKPQVLRVLLIESGACLLPLALVSPWLALCAGAVCAGAWAWFGRFCSKQFGGVTGDLAGFLIVGLETVLLALCAAGGLLLR